MRYRIGAVTLLAALLWPATVAAQEPTPPPSSVHTRAGDGADTILDVEDARLIVPAGAVASGAVIAFGTGGIPAADGSLGHTGVLVSAAGGLLGPVVVLIAPLTHERAAQGSGTPALRATAGGSVHPCATSGAWVACPMPRAGAYVLEATDAPPSSDPVVRAALARVPQADDAGSAALVVRVLVIAGAAIGGGAIAWLLGRPRKRDQGPAERA
ncbi:MAG: hypothetical protein AB7U18_16650 [Dehalococcoidia bacterium]